MIRKDAYNRILIKMVGLKLFQNCTDLRIELVNGTKITCPIVSLLSVSVYTSKPFNGPVLSANRLRSVPIN